MHERHRVETTTHAQMRARERAGVACASSEVRSRCTKELKQGGGIARGVDLGAGDCCKRRKAKRRPMVGRVQSTEGSQGRWGKE
eukprot:2192558-Pleurochrysis_carterae.AAC.1